MNIYEDVASVPHLIDKFFTLTFLQYEELQSLGQTHWQLILKKAGSSYLILCALHR